MKNPTEVIWERDYGKFSVRKVKRAFSGTYGRFVVRYDVSVSDKRTSWYNNFYNWQEANSFGKLLKR